VQRVGAAQGLQGREGSMVRLKVGCGTCRGAYGTCICRGVKLAGEQATHIEGFGGWLLIKVQGQMNRTRGRAQRTMVVC